ncbi:MAG TPA: hypothetical protein VI912_03380 [Candidatus Bilamarchaeaceae archaeon]|nr:hypothetical protein [Candidatus Bilamarchaeaceae archaeon]
MVSKNAKVLAVLFLCFLVFGCIKPSPDPQNISKNDSPIVANQSIANESDNRTIQMTQDLCEQSGGRWNECGSACAGEPPGTVCIQSCVEVCECEDSSQCPEGFECKKSPPIEGRVYNAGVCKLLEG